MKTLLRFFIPVFFVLVSSVSAFAGGPLYTMNGKAVRYQSNVITYKLDRGPLGIFSSTQARTLANECFGVWENVATSNLSFSHTDADTLPVDVNGTNFLQYTTLDDFKYDGLNPIIFDSDGAITDEIFGIGSNESVIGFAGSGDSDGDGDFDEGEAILNGLFADGSPSGFTYDEWKATFVHEFGHFLGLDHTQIGVEFENDAAKTIYVPTMYPFATVNDVPLGSLNPDDIAAISVLYPETGYAASVGTISGAVTRANATVVRGANVVAISSGADSLMNRLSTVTDYFEQNNGNYAITGLSAGSYHILIEPINVDFVEGSSVGPYSWEAGGLSFINPIAPEYYNGANESGDPATDDPDQKTSVSVTIGNTVTAVNLIANSKPAGSALIEEDFDYSGELALNGWSVHNGGTTNPLLTTDGLSYPGYSNNSGNAVLVNNLGGVDVNKGFSDLSGSGTSVFASLLVKVTETGADKTGDHLFHLGNRSSATTFTNFSSRLFVRVVAGAVNFGTTNNSTVTYGTTNFAKNTTYLAIMKYTINASGNDEVKLWVKESGVPGSEASAGTPLVTNSATIGHDLINAVGIRQGSGTTSVQTVLDGIRVSSTWPGTPMSVKSLSGLGIPSSVELMQNYPNPFNPSTSIRFGLPSAQHAKVRIFDLLGRQIALLAEGQFSAGSHEILFNASELSSGTYFYSLETGSHRELKRMVLLK